MSKKKKKDCICDKDTVCFYHDRMAWKTFHMKGGRK